jgi:phosphatidylglycerol---prolipoprotein diacylglyceryl transferase
MLENSNKKNIFFTPRIISFILLGLGIFLSFALFIPFSLVFSRKWKLNQRIDIADQVFIDLHKFGLDFLAPILGLNEPVLPIGSVSIRFYSILILIAVLSGYFLVLHLSKIHFVVGTIIDRLILGLIISGILGARLFFVVFNWDKFSDQPLTILSDINKGGLAFFGMLLFGSLYLIFYCSRFRFNIYEFLDFITPGVLLGQIIGRFGNFFNYEGYGPETSVFWKMFVPSSANYYSNDLNATYFHPTFLYEIIPNFFLLTILLYFYSELTKKRSGFIFGIYAISYGFIRFFTEFFRLDALKIYIPTNWQISIGYLTKIEYIYVSQIACLILILIGIVTIYKRNKIIYTKKDMQEINVA